jgi:uncharacterized protein (DUF111 family)
MSKVRFVYRKADGSEKERTVVSPSFVKESYNKFGDADNEKVNYVQGYEIEDKDLTKEQIEMYETAIHDYFALAIPTIEEFLSENNLDPTKVKFKTFKKSNINNLKTL